MVWPLAYDSDDRLRDLDKALRDLPPSSLLMSRVKDEGPGDDEPSDATGLHADVGDDGLTDEDSDRDGSGSDGSWRQRKPARQRRRVDSTHPALSQQDMERFQRVDNAWLQYVQDTCMYLTLLGSADDSRDHPLFSTLFWRTKLPVSELLAHLDMLGMPCMLCESLACLHGCWVCASVCGRSDAAITNSKRAKSIEWLFAADPGSRQDVLFADLSLGRWKALPQLLMHEDLASLAALGAGRRAPVLPAELPCFASECEIVHDSTVGGNKRRRRQRATSALHPARLDLSGAVAVPRGRPSTGSGHAAVDIVCLHKPQVLCAASSEWPFREESTGMRIVTSTVCSAEQVRSWPSLPALTLMNCCHFVRDGAAAMYHRAAHVSVVCARVTAAVQF